MGPISTLSAIETELLRTPRITAVSMTTQFSPIVTLPLSAVITTPKPIEEFGPMVTSPQITAFGAMRAEGSMLGFLPLCSRIMASSFGSPLDHDTAGPASRRKLEGAPISFTS